MIPLTIEFCMMYDRGENSPTQFETEEMKSFTLPAIPRFKDRIEYDGREYVVWDVVFDLENKDVIQVKAVRRVSYPLTPRPPISLTVRRDQ